MTNDENIRQRLFFSADAELAEAVDRVLDSNSFLETGKCPVLDIDGQPLVKGEIYECHELIKVREWEFGSGNLLDRYYRVFYTDTELNDSFFVVDAKYPNGVFGRAVYQSKLTLKRENDE